MIAESQEETHLHDIENHDCDDHYIPAKQGKVIRPYQTNLLGVKMSNALYECWCGWRSGFVSNGQYGAS